MKRMSTTAIVGCGWVAESQMGRGFHRLRDRFDVSLCCDVDHGRAEAFAARYGIARAVVDFDTLLMEPSIDVVSVCTPPSLHYDMVAKALRAGKHVICEKPFTSSLNLMDEVIELQEGAAGRVMPIFQYRFAPGIQRIRHLLRSGIQGKAFISSVETAWRRDADYYTVPWRGKFATELGGVLLTQAIHIHDLFMWLMGPVAEVKAFKATRVNPIEVEDCAVASLLMADGSLASLTATLGSLRPTTRIRLCFENLTIERNCFDADAPKPGDEPWTVVPRTPEIGAEAEEIMAATPPFEVDFAGQFADFHESLESGKPFVVGLEDARRALELVTALFHASESGENVALPIGPGHPRYQGWHNG